MANTYTYNIPSEANEIKIKMLEILLTTHIFILVDGFLTTSVVRGRLRQGHHKKKEKDQVWSCNSQFVTLLIPLKLKQWIPQTHLGLLYT